MTTPREKAKDYAYNSERKLKEGEMNCFIRMELKRAYLAGYQQAIEDAAKGCKGCNGTGLDQGMSIRFHGKETNTECFFCAHVRKLKEGQ
jgi:hypothetical protein